VGGLVFLAPALRHADPIPLLLEPNGGATDDLCPQDSVAQAGNAIDQLYDDLVLGLLRRDEFTLDLFDISVKRGHYELLSPPKRAKGGQRHDDGEP